jgi:hypothetical protein
VLMTPTPATSHQNRMISAAMSYRLTSRCSRTPPYRVGPENALTKS